MTRFDTAVVGNGLFGSAAARHLSRLDERVVVMGPREPDDPSRHDGVFSSHYDEGRLTRLIDRNEIWAPLTRRAVSGYPALEQASGIDFHHPVGALIVGHPDIDGPTDDPRARAEADGVAHDYHPPGDRAWRTRFPFLEFPETHYVVHEPAPAGYINPRRLIEAQNAVAVANGTVIVAETAVSIRSTPDGMVVTVDSGSTVRADKVLVAAGAFTNFNDLLPAPLPLRLETEVIALGRVDEAAAGELGSMPTVKYLIDDPVLADIYMVPPVRYPDGAHYVKVGANTTSDRNLDTAGDVQAWFRHGESDDHRADFERVLRAMWPATVFESVQTKRCIVCRTPSGSPIIDRVGEATFVATGGNGAGAKGSDGWGELAAGLVHDGRWPAGVPRFR